MQQSKLLEQSAIMCHIPTATGITSMVLGWIISSTPIGEI
jgi:hypothetical protein